MLKRLFEGAYEGKRVFITGHSGFKGSWLAFWLGELGADVWGYSLDIPTEPSHFKLLRPRVTSIWGDIRDESTLDEALSRAKPDIIFHLAAQPLVRPSYQDPVLTYDTNVIGTLKVFEAARKAGTRAIVNITSDKAYENREQTWGYREDDMLGGYDPYSSSKGCAEILTSSYRRSFFNLADYGKTHHTLLASVRAGNVIGGGDWADERLVCDIVRAAAKGETVSLRNPRSTRPWQHVLEPLSGYLALGVKLLQGRKEFAEAWNFAPDADADTTVIEVAEELKKHWKKIKFEVQENANAPHEASLLKLDATKARMRLGWHSVWKNTQAFEQTAKWYRDYYELGLIDTRNDLAEYIKKAREQGLWWAK
jgi:CDP-glucose 4,6-dehydratase